MTTSTRQVFQTPEALLTQPVDIVVVGAGGNGSAMLDALASMEVTLRAVGHPGFRVTVFDPDTVSPANIGRQRFTTADIGRNKATVLVHRINLFYGLDWHAEAVEYHGPNPQRIDLLISCVDSIGTRLEIVDGGDYHHPDALWLDLGNDAAEGQVVLGHLGDPVIMAPEEPEPLRLPHIVDLHPELRSAEEREEGPSCSVQAAIRRQQWPVNRVAANHAATLLWTLFRKGRTDWHGVTFTLDPPTVAPLYIDRMTWALYGYEPPVMEPCG